jgi:two-component system cell cycle response regulator DivK
MTVHQFRDSLSPRLVLIVDAHADTRALYKAFLIPNRYAVATAADGSEAWAHATEDIPDIIVTETQLPGIDGYTLCERLRANRRTEAVPIVVLTAESRTGQLERARQAGADTVLVKPCLPEVLLLEMQKLRDHSRELRARAQEVRRRAHAGIADSIDVLARSHALRASTP